MNAITKSDGQPPVAAVPAPRHTSLLMDPNRFEHVQRIAKVYAMSPLFPEHLRKGTPETAVANAILVLNIADRLQEDALTVAQAIYFVSGKPGWSTSYCIAKANQHGVFKNPIDWEVTGKGDSLSVTAFAETANTGRRVQVTCDMAMAKAEGWTKNSKYKSMPEQMLRYRSATFLIRLYCPEILVGVPVQAEVEMGMKDVTPSEAAEMTQAAQTVAEEAEVVTEKAEPEADTATEDVKAEDEASEARDDQKEAGEPDDVVENDDDGPDQEKLDKHKMTKSHIEQDLADGAPQDATRQFFAEALDLMKAEAPEIYAEVDKMLIEES